MSKWLRNSFIILVTLFTFGVVTPAQAALLYDNSYQDRTAKKDHIEFLHSDETYTQDENEIPLADGKEDFIKQMVKEAELHSYEKFGTKIKPVIEDEFNVCILPNIEAAIAEIAEHYPKDSLKKLTISESPTGGSSEKIFHIFNEETKEDIIRFHVRRDHPPQQGYWFNFHYHTYHDGFQKHHELGAIYWDKNTPPKWMS
ncbi:YpjP family protein [Cytobacillus gottheilii]|uniref:YpjP family protein n=1 Tax=Cytobacillus gottheilii TaxID=859144 RepID=UPI0009BA4F2E|nr:YpjP family protein [Cytobacillus gottheilii]